MYRPIEDRRSIRSFSDREVPDEVVRALVAAGIKAPSSKNRQPWRFVVVKGAAKQQMLDAFADGLRREERQPLLPGSKQHLAGARYTLAIMKQAPVTVFVLNTLGRDLHQSRSPEEKLYDLANVQSIGAAIQNILLAATEQGLGSLWICDVFFAYEELRGWLHSDGELVAAIALGYPLESPNPRPRKPLETVVEWRE